MASVQISDCQPKARLKFHRTFVERPLDGSSQTHQFNLNKLEKIFQNDKLPISSFPRQIKVVITSKVLN